jgi:hypothetical protein
MATIGVRAAGRPARFEARERITGIVRGAQYVAGMERLAEYIERYERPDDHWFAARMYMRLAEPGRALAMIFGSQVIADAPDTAERFAKLALYTVGWEDAARTTATAHEPDVLIALVEGGDPWAVERLREQASTLDLITVTRYFYPAYSYPSRVPMDHIVAALRTRTDDERLRTAAALGALRAEPYPQRAADLRALIELVSNNSWRAQIRNVWCVSCLALGRCGDPEAIAALRKMEAHLEGSLRPRDQADLLLVRNGLVAAGEWTADESIAASVFGPEPDAMVTNWYLEALIHRYLAGDMRSELRLRQMWEGPGARLPGLRHRTASAFLLTKQPPSQEAQDTWVERMLDELEEPRASLVSRVLAKAYRLRRDMPGARAALLETMHEIAAGLGRGRAPAGEAANALVHALRALYLYG